MSVLSRRWIIQYDYCSLFFSNNMMIKIPKKYNIHLASGLVNIVLLGKLTHYWPQNSNKCIILVYICLECLPGKYGQGCLYSCTGHCLNDKVCNITTGRCDVGCKPGYTGEICDTGISKQSDICLLKTIKNVKLCFFNNYT